MDSKHLPQAPLTRLEDGLLTVVLEGRVDETTDFAAIDLTGARSLRLRLDGVTAFTSFGVKRWLGFVERVPAELPVTLAGCSVAIVHQLTSLPHFLGQLDARIASYYVPYYCERCDKSCRFLVERGEVAARERRCDDCAEVLEPESPTQYAAFAKRFAAR